LLQLDSPKLTVPRYLSSLIDQWESDALWALEPHPDSYAKFKAIPGDDFLRTTHGAYRRLKAQIGLLEAAVQHIAEPG
jgi:hypothetical protein